MGVLGGRGRWRWQSGRSTTSRHRRRATGGERPLGSRILRVVTDASPGGFPPKGDPMTSVRLQRRAAPLASHERQGQRTSQGAVALVLTIEAQGGEDTICLDVIACQAVKTFANEARRDWLRRLRGRAAAPAATTLNLVEPIGARLHRRSSRMGHWGGAAS